MPLLRRTCRMISISQYVLACIVLPMVLLLSITALLLQPLDFKQKEIDDIDNSSSIDPRHIFTSGNNNNIFDDASTAQQVSSAGYQLLPEVPEEGWTLLNPVRSLFDIGLYRAIERYNDSSRRLSAVPDDRLANLLSSSWSTRTSSQYTRSSAALRRHRTTRSLSLASSHLA